MENKAGPKIAIIGAGIGGTTCAYFLNENFKGQADVTLFEMGPVGGRLATVTMGGVAFEAGGAVIHPANKLMTHLLEVTGLEPARDAKYLRGWKLNRYSMYESDSVIFKESRWSIVALFQLIWRYGFFVLYRSHRLISRMVRDFARVYETLDNGDHLDDVQETLVHMSAPGTDSALQDTTLSLTDKLIKAGLSEQFIDEFGMAAMKVNYGQKPSSTHAFVGQVSLAGAQEGLWSVKGGNKRVPEQLVKLSKCNFKRAKVHEVELLDVGNYSVRHKEMLETTAWLMNEGSKRTSALTPSDSTDLCETFDMVVIATPMTADKASLELTGLPVTPNFPGRYHRTVATFVRGEINPKFQGLASKDEMTAVTFFLDDPNLSSIELLLPADHVEPLEQVPEVWKIFSQAPVSESQLGKMFCHIDEVKVVDWLAYPQYTQNEKAKLGSFSIYDGLYYLSAIEMAASAMEMSAIAGRNIANAIYNSWCESENGSNDDNSKDEDENDEN